MSSSDPLSFFAGTDSSSSDSEVEDVGLDKKDDLVPETLDGDKLPSPDSLFASVGTPSFLHDPSSGRVNWDKFVKNRTDPEELNIHTSEGGRYAAIAPPTGTDESSMHNKKVHSSLTAAIIKTYSSTSGEIAAPPVRYSTKEVDPKFRTVSDGGEGGKKEDMPAPVAGKHDMSSSNHATDESGSVVKKQKTENFRQKEKRKRDVGQTSRGKSYVEEEKRILRQSFAMDEIMS